MAVVRRRGALYEAPRSLQMIGYYPGQRISISGYPLKSAPGRYLYIGPLLWNCRAQELLLYNFSMQELFLYNHSVHVQPAAVPNDESRELHCHNVNV
ncbi:hypothetical protein EVAR_36411_1 [Eumeta japonica]|uniref:Uncharacterized protein n=1 Tax=Eumeta variegata TaxID=151549 RepID=A0A4C1VS90_EUMVA|nr:hypothetical protein EVAR_36411_1 [Eumeta japonica]